MPLAFVTGATGFVGLNLIEALGRDGWDVVALHRSSSDVSELLHRGVERREGDITDLDAVRSAMPEHADVVFHVAGDTSLWRRHRAGPRDGDESRPSSLASCSHGSARAPKAPDHA